MNNKKWTFFFPVFLMLLFSCQQREDVRQYAATESYPEDTVLEAIEVKRAMIVVAHDDDMCAVAGTASLLKKNGWEIAVMSFSKSPEQNAAQLKACSSLSDTVMFVDLKPEQYRNDLANVKEAYYAIPREDFGTVFNRSLVEPEFVNRINEFNPAVIFTLDNEMGGYGHPDHVFVSQLVLDLTLENLISPQYIYQSVYTDHMENTIMKRHSERMKSWGFPGDEWENAKRIYGVEGMPQPNVQLNITSESNVKMDYLRSYNKRERKILGFFIPEFEKYTATEYFTIFDREFYRIIEAEAYKMANGQDL